MDLHLMIGMIGLLYILVFGGMSLLRREGLSIRFAVEAVIITALAVLLVVLTPIQIHPVLFLLLLYIVTLRIRVLIDLANSLARRGKYSQAEKLYDLAASLWPDPTNELIIKVNRATMLLHKDQVAESISMFTDVLSQADKGYLGVKYEAAAHFNLGVAYLRNNNNSMATIQFNEAIDTWPASLYAHRAEQALGRLHSSTDAHTDDRPEK